MGSKLSIIIVSWNVVDLLEACLHSIQATCQDLSHEIIVVDNASSDTTVSRISEFFPTVRLIANQDNRGFAGGNNQGIEIASGEYILLLNPDTVVQDGALKRLIEYMDENPQVGVAGPKLLYANGKIQMTAARLLPTLLFQFVYAGLALGNSRLLRSGVVKRLSAPYDFEKTQYVEAISGAATIIRRAIIDTVGVLDDGYKHSGEDIDYYLRVGKHGWKIAYIHDAVIIHHSGQSSKQASYRTLLQGVAGTDRFYRLHYGKVHVLGFRLIMTFCRAPVMFVNGLLRVILRKDDLDKLSQRLEATMLILRWNFKKVGMDANDDQRNSKVINQL